MSEEEILFAELNKVDIGTFREQMFKYFLNYKNLKPFDDKKANDYWRYIGMAFFNDPNIKNRLQSNQPLTPKSLEMIDKLNQIDEILNKVILISNEKYMGIFNFLTEKNVSLESLVIAIKNLPE